MPLLATASITSPVTDTVSEPEVGLGAFTELTVQARWSPTGGGTSLIAYIETSIDGGVSWVDIARIDYATGSRLAVFGIVSGSLAVATYAALSSEGTRAGFLGDRLRLRYTSTGTFSAGSQLTVHYAVRGY